MTATQRRRLYKLAAFLGGEVALRVAEGRKKFDMGAFSEGAVTGDGKIGLDEAHCGTSGCALGWASVCFPKTITLINGIPYLYGNVKYGSPSVWAKDFFGLTSVEVSEAFFSGWDRTPAEEAAVLFKLAEDGYKASRSKAGGESGE